MSSKKQNIFFIYFIKMLLFLQARLHLPSVKALPQLRYPSELQVKLSILYLLVSQREVLLVKHHPPEKCNIWLRLSSLFSVTLRIFTHSLFLHWSWIKTIRGKTEGTRTEATHQKEVTHPVELSGELLAVVALANLAHIALF